MSVFVLVAHTGPMGFNSNLQPADRRRRVQCIECRQSPSERWLGWRAYRYDDPARRRHPVVAFYCPACAFREFDEPDRSQTGLFETEPGGAGTEGDD
jgi:hypothetical protein